MKTRRALVVVALAAALLGLYALVTNLHDRPETQAQQGVTVEIDDSKAVATYANICRVSATRDEVFLDFAVSSHPPGQAEKPIPVKPRIIVNFYTAKRMLQALNMTVERHEEVFGSLDLDGRNQDAGDGALDDSQVLASYANFCRVTGTPEEMIVDFGLNPQPIGVPTEAIRIEWRVITNFANAKRLTLAMQSAIQRHEADHGPLETDIQKRMIDVQKRMNPR
jgi:hypothetical protein